MSRTYRKTSTKQGQRRQWKVRHMAQFDHKKAEFVKPYLVPMNITEKVTEEYETDYHSYCPIQLRIYVSPGTPHALEELGSIICWQKYPLPARREPSKWYLVPLNEIKTRTFKRYLGRNPEYSDIDWVDRWQKEHLFNHVRKNDTGARKTKSARNFDRRQHTRGLRREMKISLRDFDLLQPDQLREDMLNVHLEPHNWLLDESPDHLDYYDSIDEFFWDDCHDDLDRYDCNNCQDRGCNTCDPYEYNPYDIDYEYDDWGDWH